MTQKRARVIWTSVERRVVADRFMLEYPNIEQTQGGLRKAIENAQFILEQSRRRSLVSPGTLYNIRNELLLAHEEGKKLDAEDKQADTALQLKALVTSSAQANSDATTLKPTPRFQAIMPVPPLKPVVEAPKAPGFGTVVAIAVEKELKKALPVLVEQMSRQFSQLLQDALAQQRREIVGEMLRYWEGDTSQKSSVQDQTPAAEDYNLGLDTQSLISAVPCSKHKTKVLILGAKEDQRRAYEEALSDCEIEVTKNEQRVYSTSKFDILVVLADFVHADAKRKLHQTHGDKVKFVRGTVSAAVREIRMILNSH